VIDVRAEVLEAEGRIREHIRRTPVEESIWLGDRAGCDVYLKLENLQATSSFKLRGAVNRMLSLSEEERSKGVVTASSGNHGSAVAYLLRRFGWPGVIYLPETASKAKVGALERYGAELKFFGKDGIETEVFARQVAEDSGRVFVSPYNDEKIIGGQGTIGLELEGQLERIDTVLIPVGGGGLAAGVAGYLKAADSSIEIIGCQPVNSKVMYESLEAGKILDLASQPTLADGTAGGIEVDSLTFPICQEVIDDFILVEEDEILHALAEILTKHHLLIEGAAALSVAALLKSGQRFEGKTVVLILTGARLSLDALSQVLALGLLG
jgi:threonine dehydratase